jgi:hypothetical protein
MCFPKSLTFAGILLAVGLITPSVLPAWIPAPEYRSRQLQIQRQVDLQREIQRLRSDQMSRELKQQIRDLNAQEYKRRLQLELWKARQLESAAAAPWPAVIPGTPPQPSSNDRQEQDKPAGSTGAESSAVGPSDTSEHSKK